MYVLFISVLGLYIVLKLQQFLKLIKQQKQGNHSPLLIK